MQHNLKCDFNSHFKKKALKVPEMPRAFMFKMQCHKFSINGPFGVCKLSV